MNADKKLLYPCSSVFICGSKSNLERRFVMPVDDVLLDAEMHMEKAIDHLQHELRGIRTGRASPALVENIHVDYYGTPTPIKNIANISVPEATQLLIKPFSPGDLKAIEKGIN